MQVTNEVLATKMDAMGERLGKVENKLDAIPTQFGQTFISREFFELNMKNLETQLQNNQIALKNLGTRRTWLNWLLPAISAVLGSVFTFLLISYITGGKQ